MLSTFLKYLVDVLKRLIYVKSRGSKKTFCKYLSVKIHMKYCYFVGGGIGQTTFLNSTHCVCALVREGGMCVDVFVFTF